MPCRRRTSSTPRKASRCSWASHRLTFPRLSGMHPTVKMDRQPHHRQHQLPRMPRNQARASFRYRATPPSQRFIIYRQDHRRLQLHQISSFVPASNVPFPCLRMGSCRSPQFPLSTCRTTIEAMHSLPHVISVGEMSSTQSARLRPVRFHDGA